MIRNDFYGNQYKWFTGIVKDVLGGNAVRVRVFGVHHIEDEVKVSDKDLPIAYVLYPVDYSNLHSMKEGDWVYGFFLDGDNCQQPVVTGIFTGGGITGNSRNSSNQFDCTFGGSSDYDANLVGASDPAKIYNFLYTRFKNAGAANPHAATVGLMGNLEHESGFRTSIRSSVPGEQSFGLAQWNVPAGRFGQLQNYAKEKSGNKEDWKKLYIQLNFIWHELSTTEKKSKRLLLASQSPKQAAENAIHFFRPRGYPSITGSSGYADRVRRALKFDKQLRGSYQPGPASDTPSKLADYNKQSPNPHSGF